MTQSNGHHRVADEEANRYRVAAIVVSWISVLFSSSTGISGIGKVSLSNATEVTLSMLKILYVCLAALRCVYSICVFTFFWGDL